MALTQITTDGIKDGTITGTDLTTSFATTGDFTLTGANYNATWDKSTNSLNFVDSAQLKLGTGGDIKLYHTGSHSFFTNATGNFHIRTDTLKLEDQSNGHAYITAVADGAVELYHNNVKKFETTSAGATVTGELRATADLKMNTADNQKINLGMANDLQIYHDGNHSYINDTGSGLLKVVTSGFQVRNAADNETIIYALENGAVNLYYDNSKKFHTYSGGCSVFGNFNLEDNDRIRLGDASDLQIYHDGSNSFIKDTGTGALAISGSQVSFDSSDSSEYMIKAVENAQVELYYNGSKKFETTSTGVTVTGALAATSLSATGGITGTGGNFILGDSSGTSNNRIKLGASGDLQIYHDGSNSIISEQGTGDLTINSTSLNLFNNDIGGAYATFASNGAVELFYAGSKKFETTSSGVQLSGDLDTNSNHILLNDTAQLKMGASNDFIIRHNAAGGIGGGNTLGGSATTKFFNPLFEIYKQDGTKKAVVFDADNGQELYYNNSKKFETFNDGIEITGDVYPEANNTRDLGSDTLGWNSIWASTRFRGNDNVKLILGNAQDLQIYHDGSNSRILSSTGELQVFTHNFRVLNDAGNEIILQGAANGAVELYHNNSRKFFTSSVGINSATHLPDTDNAHDLGASYARWDDVFATNGTIQTSDKNEKENITNSDLGLDFINKLSPKSFKFKGKTRTHYGLVAQDIETVITDLGKTTTQFAPLIKNTLEDGTERYGLRYTELLSPLIKAVQELSAEVAALKAG